MANDLESCLKRDACKDWEKYQAELIGFSISYMCDAISAFIADIMTLYVTLIVSSLIIYHIEVDSRVAKQQQLATCANLEIQKETVNDSRLCPATSCFCLDGK